jgi:hypothetical protein
MGCMQVSNGAGCVATPGCRVDLSCTGVNLHTQVVPGEGHGCRISWVSWECRMSSLPSVETTCRGNSEPQFQNNTLIGLHLNSLVSSTKFERFVNIITSKIKSYSIIKLFKWSLLTCGSHKSTYKEPTSKTGYGNFKEWCKLDECCICNAYMWMNTATRLFSSFFLKENEKVC